MTNYREGQILYTGMSFYAEFYVVRAVVGQWVIVSPLDRPKEKLAVDITELDGFKEADDHIKQDYLYKYRIARATFEDVTKEYGKAAERASAYELGVAELGITPQEIEQYG